MSGEERAVFASTILVERAPKEAANVFLSRLLESKGLNNQIGSFLFDYMMINRHYANKLKKILDTKGKSLNQSIDQYVKKEAKHDAKYRNAVALDNDHLGEFGALWNGILDDIREEIYISETFCNNMEKQLISPLKKCFDINKNKKYNNMLDSILDLSKTADNVTSDESVGVNGGSHKFGMHKKSVEGVSNDDWAVKSPQVSETFENFEYNRLLFLKDAFISFQNNLNYRFNENLKHNENLFSVLVGFNPDDEITRFANKAASIPDQVVSGKTEAETAKAVVPSSLEDDDVNSPPIVKKSGFENAVSGVVGAAAVSADHSADFQAPPLHSQKSNPSTINSSDLKKRGGLRSKVGTLFGRKKNKKRHDSITSDSIVEDAPQASHAKEIEQPKENLDAGAKPPAKLDEPVAVGLKEQTLNPRSSFLNGNEEPNDSLSIAQKPLVPNVRNASSSSLFKNNAAKNNAAKNNAAPPPPPTRKTISEPVDQPVVAGKRDRKDIQSKLFTNLTTAAIMDHNSQDRLLFINEDQAVLPPLPKNASYSISEASKKHVSDAGSLHSNGVFANAHDNVSSASLAQSQLTTLAKAGNRFIHPELNQSGLNASVSELIKVSLRDGVTESCQIIGEIALTWVKPPLSQLPYKSYLKLEDCDGVVEKLIPNHSFIELIETNSTETTKVFLLNPSQISSRTLGGLKYLVSSRDSPVIILPVWRYESHQASCMITVRLADRTLARLPPGTSVALDNFIISIALEDGVEIQSAMSRPSGTFNKEKRRITWKYTEPVTLNSSHPEEKIVARFKTEGMAQESKKGAQAKFVIKHDKGGDYAVSNIKLDYNAVESNIIQEEQNRQWENVNTVKTFATNVFTAHSI